MRTLFTVGFLVLVACGDSAPLEPDAGIDAPPSLTDVSCPNGFGLPNVGVIVGGDLVRAAALGDLDADGHADLVYAASSGAYAQVFVRRGLGGRNFGDAVEIESPRDATDLAIGDVTGDGKADLVVVTWDGMLSVHASTGGTLAAAVSYAIPGSATRVVLADIGGTTALDAIVLGRGYTILVNQGDGAFAAPTQYDMYSRWGEAAVGDFDGDAKADVALLRGTGEGTMSVEIALGNGDGTLAALTSHDLAFFPTGIAVADLDQDTYADLVVSGSGLERTHVLRGTASGFVAGAEHDAGYLGAHIVDYDADGVLDLVFADRIVRGTSTGAFEDGVVVPATLGAEEVLVAQLDGAESLDLVVRRNNTFEVLLSTSAPSSRFTIPGKLGEIYGTAAADFDGNGTLDLASAYHYANPELLPGMVAVQLNTEHAFGDAVGYPAGYANVDVIAGDLDDDGDVDLVATHGAFSASPGTTLLRNDGSGTFTTMYVPFGGRARPVIADMNGDDRLDIVVSGGDASTGGARVAVLLGQADGSFVPEVTFPSAAYALAVADIDHANGLDLLVSDQSDRVVVMLSNSDGTFNESTSLAHGSAGAVAAGDLDGDGHVDVVLRSSNGGVPVVFRNNGDGTFAAAQMIAMDVGSAQGYPGTPRQVLVTDIDGDTKLDLVVPHATHGIASIALGRGDGTFEPQLDFATAGVPTSIATVDHDDDRRRELVVSSGGAVQIFPHVCLP